MSNAMIPSSTMSTKYPSSGHHLNLVVEHLSDKKAINIPQLNKPTIARYLPIPCLDSTAAAA